MDVKLRASTSVDDGSSAAKVRGSRCRRLRVGSVAAVGVASAVVRALYLADRVYPMRQRALRRRNSASCGTDVKPPIHADDYAADARAQSRRKRWLPLPYPCHLKQRAQMSKVLECQGSQRNDQQGKQGYGHPAYRFCVGEGQLIIPLGWAIQYLDQLAYAQPPDPSGAKHISCS